MSGQAEGETFGLPGAWCDAQRERLPLEAAVHLAMEMLGPTAMICSGRSGTGSLNLPRGHLIQDLAQVSGRQLLTERDHKP